MEHGVYLDRALELAMRHPLRRSSHDVDLDSARNRVISHSLESLVDDPRFDNSAMDGFAVRSSDCITPKVELSIVGTSQAGGDPPPGISAGERRAPVGSAFCPMERYSALFLM